MTILKGMMADYDNRVDGLLAHYENGLLNEHEVVEKLYHFYPNCIQLMDDYPELLELMDLYVFGLESSYSTID